MLTPITFSLDISAEQYIRVYQGSAKTVHVTADNGQTLQFPAKVIQPFLTHQGIVGHFVLYHNNGKFERIERL